MRAIIQRMAEKCERCAAPTADYSFWESFENQRAPRAVVIRIGGIVSVRLGQVLPRRSAPIKEFPQPSRPFHKTGWFGLPTLLLSRARATNNINTPIL